MSVVQRSEAERAVRAEATEAQALSVRLAAVTAAAAFRARGWTWGRTAPHSPTVDQIEETLWSLIGGVAINGSGSCGTGRLYADVGDEGDICLLMNLGRLSNFIAADETDVAA